MNGKTFEPFWLIFLHLTRVSPIGNGKWINNYLFRFWMLHNYYYWDKVQITVFISVKIYRSWQNYSKLISEKSASGHLWKLFLLYQEKDRKEYLINYNLSGSSHTVALVMSSFSWNTAYQEKKSCTQIPLLGWIVSQSSLSKISGS